MSLALRKRVLGIALLVLTVWPVVQIASTELFETSPWKFAAWGMYSLPDSRPGVRIEVEAVGRFEKRPWEEVGMDLAPLVRRFQFLRDYLGLLVQPDALAEAILERHPEWPAITIVVQDLFLEPETALITSVDRRIVYRR